MPVHRHVRLPSVIMAREWIWITGTDGTDHLVTAPAMELGRLDGAGRYVAACARLMEVAAMVAPPQRRCARCEPWSSC